MPKQRFGWRFVVGVAAVLGTMATGVAAVAQEPATSFEVAVIRQAKPNSKGSNLDEDPAQFKAKNSSVLTLLQFAYDLNNGSRDQIVGAPSWVSSEAFDITTKPSAATVSKLAGLTGDQKIEMSRQMLRQLLAERFHLAVHHQTRKIPVLALTAAKGGSKLVAVKTHRKRSKKDPESWEGLHNPGRGHTVGHAASMTDLVSALTWRPEVGGRLIVDRTGLTGEYDFDLKWAPQAEAGQDATDADGPSLFTALQEQLGLTLKSQKAPVDCIVIDHIEQPTAN